MAKDEYPDFVECPLVGHEIKAIDCIENRDIVEGNIAPIVLPKFTTRRGWKEICRACKWYNVY